MSLFHVSLPIGPITRFIVANATGILDGRVMLGSMNLEGASGLACIVTIWLGTLVLGLCSVDELMSD